MCDGGIYGDVFFIGPASASIGDFDGECGEYLFSGANIVWACRSSMAYPHFIFMMQ